MDASASTKRSPLIFFLLVLALSVPFWLIGVVVGDVSGLPMDLPISALGVFCPLIAASILVYRESGADGIRDLFRKTFDFTKIKEKVWYVPIVFLMPVIMLSSYGVMLWLRLPLPEPQIAWITTPILFLVFFIGGMGEELGWMGYAIEPMLDRWSALQASIIMGSFWAIWHVIPLIQAQHAPLWIAWHCFGMIGTRVIIVWLYNSTGKSVFAAIVFHAVINVSMSLFPNNGSHYDPVVTGIIVTAIALIVTLLWGSKTLARYRTA